MPSQWDHKADKDLLLTIIETGSLTHIDWHAVAAALKAKDYNFSHEACRQHYQKIRKESRKATSSSTTTTPSKPSTTSKATPSTSARKRSAKAILTQLGNGDDDEEDLRGSPSPSVKRKKSMKTEKLEGAIDTTGFLGQTAAQFKLEEEGDGMSQAQAIDLDGEGIYEA